MRGRDRGPGQGAPGGRTGAAAAAAAVLVEEEVVVRRVESKGVGR